MSGNHDHPVAGDPTDLGHAFLVGILLNVAFVAIEAAYGVLAPPGSPRP